MDSKTTPEQPADSEAVDGEDAPARRLMKGNTRVTGKEQFYTPPDIAHDVVALVLANVPTALERTWVEPCGGTGRFLDGFAAAGVTRMWSCDIEPQDPRVELRDFLSMTAADFTALGLKDAVVATNPPFGRNNALSVPFFNQSALFADVIAFIVPRSWRKWSVQDRLDRHFDLVADEDLAIDYEGVDGKKLSERGALKTCVQVWVRQTGSDGDGGLWRRPLHVVPDRGYVTKVSPAEADVSLTIFGRGCGSVKTEFPRVGNTTQMFLKLKDNDVLEALLRVDFARFYERVAYTEALSLKEINFLLNEWFDARADIS